MQSDAAQSLTLQASPRPHPVGRVQLNAQGVRAEFHLVPTLQISQDGGHSKLGWDGMGWGVCRIQQTGKARKARLGGVGHQGRLVGGEWV